MKIANKFRAFRTKYDGKEQMCILGNYFSFEKLMINKK